MRRLSIVGLLSIVFLLVLSCNLPVASGIEKMKPLHFDLDGTRKAFSGDYSCESTNVVTLDIDENGIASLSGTGPVFVDYINCTPDPSGFKDTYTISGLADPDTQQATFTSCNGGGFTAEGVVSYKDNNPEGTVACIHSGGEEAGETAITLRIPQR